MWEYNEAAYQLLMDFRKACDSGRREVFYDILIEPGIPMKVRIMKMCLNETYTTVRVGKLLSDMVPIKNGLKEGDALSRSLFKFMSTPLEWFR